MLDIIFCNHQVEKCLLYFVLPFDCIFVCCVVRCCSSYDGKLQFLLQLWIKFGNEVCFTLFVECINQFQVKFEIKQTQLTKSLKTVLRVSTNSIQSLTFPKTLGTRRSPRRRIFSKKVSMLILFDTI